MDVELNAFVDAMEREHGYRPRLLPSGELMHSRDADRYEGWLLNHRHSGGDGEAWHAYVAEFVGEAAMRELRNRFEADRAGEKG